MVDFINGMPAQRWMRLEAKRSGYAKEGSGSTTVRTQDRISVGRLIERGSAASANSEAATAEQKMSAAKGDLASIRALLVNARDLAISSNGVGADRIGLTTEANNFISQANQILREASFSGKKLFDPENPDQKMRLAVGGGAAFSVALSDANSTPKPNVAKVEFSQVLSGASSSQTSASNGIQSIAFGAAVSVSDMRATRQADGKIVVVATSNNDIGVARLNSDGTLDTSFGTAGKITVDVGGGVDKARDVSILADGKILVLSESSNGTDSDFGFVKLNSNGTLDTSFDGDGKLMVPVFGSDTPYKMAIDPNNKIVAVGSIQSDMGIIRLNADGTFDSTFSGDGKFTQSFGNNDGANSLMLDATGGIVVAGWTGTGNTAVMRLSQTGTLDTTFNGTGSKVFSDPGYDQATSLAIQADGKIIVGGYGYDGVNLGVFILRRLNSDGTLDNNFSPGGSDGNGVLRASSGSGRWMSSLALQADGGIVATGSTGSTFGLLRVTADGTPDSSFDGDGWAFYDLGPDTEQGVQVLVQPDGKLIMLGINNKASGAEATVIRINQDSTRDISFNPSSGGAGGSSDEVMTDIATAPDGSVYGTGWSTGNFGGVTNQGDEDAFVTKYSPSGSTIWTRMLGSTARDRGLSITTSSDGSVFVAGLTDGTLDGNVNQSRRVFVSKFSADGSTAWTKLSGAVVPTPVDFKRMGLSTSADGYVYVGYSTTAGFDGQAASGVGIDSFLTKMNTSDGSTVWTSISGAAGVDRVADLEVGSDGSVFTVGEENGNGYLRKFNSAGTIQFTSIMQGGSVQTKTNRTQTNIAIGSDGAVYASGNFGDGTGETRVKYLTKYFADGSIAWTKEFDAGAIKGMTVGTDGSVYLTGYSDQTVNGDAAPGGADVLVLKFNADGSDGGRRTINLSGSDVGNAMTVGIDGSLYLGGETKTVGATSSDVVLMKFGLESRKSLRSFGSVDLTTATYADIAVSKLNDQIAAIDSRLRGVNLGITRSKAAQKYASLMVNGLDVGIQATAPVTVAADEFSAMQETATKRNRSIAEIKQTGKRAAQKLRSSVARG
jgi:uncharacterized delta-60 repeat protein